MVRRGGERVGNEILYCAGCQTRLLASEFDKHKAFKIDSQAWCAPCAKKRFPGHKAEPSRRESSPAVPADASKFSSSTRVSIHKTPRRGTPAAGPPVGLVLAGAAGAVLVLILFFAAAGGPKPAPPRPPDPAETPTAHVPAPPPPPLPPKEPRSIVKPTVPDGEIEARRKALAALEAELGTLDGEIAAELRTQSFAAAIRRLNAARGRHTEVEWTLAVDRRLQDVASQARQALQPLLQEAVAQRAHAAAVESIRKRVAAWELPSLLQELDAALTAAVPPPPPKPAAPPLDAVWTKALAPATVRDYAAAAEALEAAAKEVPDAALKKQWADDAALLRRIHALHREALQAVAQLPKGQALEVTVYGDVRRREVKGEVERILDGATIELAGGERVEAGELSTPSLMALHRLVRRTDLDPQTAAVYSLLDSQTAEAKKRVGRATVPDRFWQFSEYKVPSDAAPRAAFENADALSREPEKAVEAAAAFRALLAEHGTTAFVQRNRATIERRAAPPKEFFFGPDRLTGGRGTRLARHAKIGSAWVSGPGAPLDLTFSADAGTAWRAWAYVGGCCAEALAFSWQIVDATEPAAVRPQIFTSHRLHAQHGGVKEATRWGWVSLSLPAFTTAGPKTLRLLPSGDGFTLAHAVVSSVRTGAPSDAEVKALRVELPENPAEAEVAKVLQDPALVGWWRFDEGQGDGLRDLTRNRNDGRLLGGPQWVPGVAGGGLSFDGQDDAVIVPPSASLDACARGFTLSAWVFRAAPQQGWRVVAMRQRGSGYKDQWFLGFGDAPKLLGVAFAPDGGKTEVHGPDTPLRKWLHLALTRDDAALRLYVDGLEVGQTDRPLEFTPEAKPLTFGAGHNGDDDRLNEHWNGILDEVRLYSRALGAAEIRALAGAPPPPALLRPR